MSGETRASRVIILHWLENALLVIAVVALGWYATVRVLTIVHQARDSRELERRITERAESAVKPIVLAPPPPALDSVVGRIEVPRLGINAIVREGTDDDTLRRAIGHLPDTPLPGTAGNVAFAGHRDTFFRNLRGVKAGDRIVVTMPDRTLAYAVKRTRIVDPTEVSVLDPTPVPTLTLITCYPFNYIGSAPKRFIVQAIGAPAAALAATPVATAGISSRAISLPGDTAKAARTKAVHKKGKAAAVKAKKATAREPEKRGFWRTLGKIFGGK